MPTRGLLLDEDELEKKGIDHESAQKMALESFYERPVEQQLVELRILCDDVATKLELVRDHLDEQTLSEMQATIDGMSVQIKHLEMICRRRAKVKAKAAKPSTFRQTTSLAENEAIEL